METFYLVVVIALFALAISDLIVGVSNDAVNFLNSAIGSKAAPKWVIFGIAALGVFVGATFSGGMMEVARKGIFVPEMFYFEEIMIIFLAVMLTDVLLLDIFNTLGLPTSTTVSIVFELLGAAVAIAVIKLIGDSQSISEIYNYINSEKALAIITGILLSVVIAFTVGAVAQWITRMVFTFDYKRSVKWFGAPFGGISLAIITYFIVIKGAKGATWIDKDVVLYIKDNTFIILGYTFIVSTILLQFVMAIFKRFDVLKFIVVLGTFALAMAFAGNDLVNFIGVPLAGFASYTEWISVGTPGSGELLMSSLSGKVETDTYLLLIAGLIMITTLITSKKARNVVATSLNLSKQGAADERFEPSPISRVIVRGAVKMSKRVDAVIGTKIKGVIETRFDSRAAVSEAKSEDDKAFDLVRAAVNLVIASVLISIGTMLKLPLSTTYVTFMVAMGTSFADRAWDRESAVYRISGVFTVIGGWFVTALVAFVVAGTVASLLYGGSKIGDGITISYLLIILALFLIVKSHLSFGKKRAKDIDDEDENIDAISKPEEVIVKSSKRIVKSLDLVSNITKEMFKAFAIEDTKMAKASHKNWKELDKRSKRWRTNIDSVLTSLNTTPIEYGQYFIQVMSHLRTLSHSTSHIVQPIYDHMKNAHRNFDAVQQEEIGNVQGVFAVYLDNAKEIIALDFTDKLADLAQEQEMFISFISEVEKRQIRRLKDEEDISTKSSMLFLNTLSEFKTASFNVLSSVKAYVDLATSVK